MKIAHTIAQARQAVKSARSEGKTIGLVPTMGGLHAGHFSLIRRSVEECDYTAVSIFVNPIQFGPGEDLNNYPRTFEADCEGCLEVGADLIFTPLVEEIYPQQADGTSDPLTWVNVETITTQLCGLSRPIHFRGVCTVVSKLFNIIQPDTAYFGQKDAQQLAVVRQMTQDLNFPVKIVGCPIVREPDGLAMSTRNKYLKPEERQQAQSLYQSLKKAKEIIESGQTISGKIIDEIEKIIAKRPLAQIDYISIVDNELLQPVAEIDRPVLIAVAVYFGQARLIDNIIVVPPEKFG